jgi:hypothetical protein
LRKKILGALGVTTELALVCSLCPVDFLVGVDDIRLRRTQIAVPVAYVHNRSLNVNDGGLLYIFNNRGAMRLRVVPALGQQYAATQHG